MLIFLGFFAIVVPILGLARDFEYIKEIDQSQMVNMAVLKALSVFHAIFKALILTTNCLIRVFVSVLGFSYIKEWLSSRETIKQTNGTAEERLYHYYLGYTGIGKSTTNVRSALQAWFVVQYLVYLLYIYADLIHILKTSLNKNFLGY